MKKYTLLSLLVLSVTSIGLVLSGSYNTALAAEKIVISMWKFGGPQHERAYIIEKNKAFEKQNPNITIEWSYQNYGTKREKVIAGNVVNELPDIIALDGQSIAEFAEMGVILPLDSLSPNLIKKWKKNYPPELWNTNTYKGKLYSVSTYVDAATFLVYNTKMFKAAGIIDINGNARPPRNWEDVLFFAKKLNKNGIRGMALPGSGHNLDVNMLEGIAYRNGGRWLKDGKVRVNGKGFVDALTLYKDLIPYSQSGYIETNFRTAAELFFQGKTAMAITESFAPILKAQFDVAPDFEYNLASFPNKQQKSGSYEKANFLMTPTNAMMVTRLVKNKAAVIKFLDFWNSYEAHKGWSGSVITGRIPTHKKSLDSETFAKVYPDLSREYKAGTLFTGALPQEGFIGLTECTKLLSVAMQEALLGVSSVQDALDEVQKSCQKVIDRAKN
jgi:sn-glycerol 3-phosphate transport system substrate-binding protein